jgi:hypothetical protein
MTPCSLDSTWQANQISTTQFPITKWNSWNSWEFYTTKVIMKCPALYDSRRSIIIFHTANYWAYPKGIILLHKGFVCLHVVLQLEVFQLNAVCTSIRHHPKLTTWFAIPYFVSKHSVQVVRNLTVWSLLFGLVIRKATLTFQRKSFIAMTRTTG